MNSIIWLYPDASDTPGKRVMIKCDSGPGQLQMKLLAKMKFLGFYLYPGVLNATAVSQETDHKYGPFKIQFQKDLDDLVQARIEKQLSICIQPSFVGLTMLGGMDPISGHDLSSSAFQIGCSRPACLSACNKVGAAPLNTNCLDDSKVEKSFEDGNIAWEVNL